MFSKKEEIVEKKTSFRKTKNMVFDKHLKNKDRLIKLKTVLTKTKCFNENHL